MVKKKKSAEEKLSAISGQLLVDEEARELPYLLGAWKGVDHYRCRECSVDSFEKKSILQHLVDKHNSEEALAMLVELEGKPTPPPAPLHQENADGEGSVDEVFEVELKEIDSTVDAQGVEHKKFVVKE